VRVHAAPHTPVGLAWSAVRRARKARLVAHGIPTVRCSLHSYQSHKPHQCYTDMTPAGKAHTARHRTPHAQSGGRCVVRGVTAAPRLRQQQLHMCAGCKMSLSVEICVFVMSWVCCRASMCESSACPHSLRVVSPRRGDTCAKRVEVLCCRRPRSCTACFDHHTL